MRIVLSQYRMRSVLWYGIIPARGCQDAGPEKTMNRKRPVSPPRPPRPEAATPKGRETKARIYEASIRLFNLEGYEAASVQDICGAAGISVGSFYHHFGSKRDILLGYVREESDRLWEHYRSLERRGRREALLSCLERYFGYFAVKGRSFVARFLSLILASEGAYYDLREFSLFGIIREAVAAGRAGGEFPEDGPGERMQEILEGWVWGATLGWCLAPAPYDLAAEALPRFRRLLDLFRRPDGVTPR